MPDTPPAAAAWLDRFFDSYYRHRPVNASFVGVHGHDHRLPDFSEEGAGDALADAEALLAESDGWLSDRGRARGAVNAPGGAPFDAGAASGRVADAAPRPADPETLALDVRLARGFLKAQRWEFRERHFHRGNPSLYTGEAVFGPMALFLGHGGPRGHRVEAAARRMEAVPALLEQGRRQVREAPPEWTRRAMRECQGALEFFGDGVDALAADEGVDRARLRGPADAAGRAVAAHLAWLESDLLRRPRQDVAAGAEALDLYLREAHFLTASADRIVAYAEEQMAEAEAWLSVHARDVGADTVEDALSGLADLHPSVGEYLARHQVFWDEIRALAEREDLLTWPDFPIRYVPRPEWSRKAAPYLYFLFYRSPAAFHRPPVHDYLVTPIEASLPAGEQRALLRAHNDSVIKLNHVVHHGGIGHHVQNWHAFRAASRVGRMAAVDCASRTAMTCAGTMAEGWACYATDLVAEHGGLTLLEAFAERHARVRMCARAIVDLELHRGRMSLDDAAAFYAARAGMPEAAARGEAVKNSMFPGGAVMYLMGTDAVHELRRDMARLQGNDFSLRDFHDTFLSWGSVPVTLIADAMKRRHADETTPHAE